MRVHFDSSDNYEVQQNFKEIGDFSPRILRTTKLWGTVMPGEKELYSLPGFFSRKSMQLVSSLNILGCGWALITPILQPESELSSLSDLCVVAKTIREAIF